jgi:hypothetical protein
MDLKTALQKLVDNGSIHWRGIYSPLGCEEELFTLGHAKRDPILIPITGMNKKGAKITKEGIAFLKRASEASSET